MMSGYILVSPNNEWQATSWLFRFVADYISSHTKSKTLSDQIGEMIEFNLPYVVDLTDLPKEVREDVISILSDQITRHAQDHLSDSLPNRELAVEHVRSLAERARRAADH